jgi:methylaspartate ammonia-lyase
MEGVLKMKKMVYHPIVTFDAERLISMVIAPDRKIVLHFSSNTENQVDSFTTITAGSTETNIDVYNNLVSLIKAALFEKPRSEFDGIE